MFWTRVVNANGGLDGVPLSLQVARDRAFQQRVLDSELVAGSESDFTVRAFVDGLDPDSAYFYRFLAPDGTASRIGRTRTTPAPDSLRPLTVAVFSCQHYSDGFFSAWRRLLVDSEAADEGRKIDIVLHLGDFIYEFPEVDLYRGDGSLVEVRNQDGSQRLVPPLPSGGPEGKVRKAVTVDDFRHLYRTYLTDPDLQEARAAFPFVCVWDDHEVTNDYWQAFVLTDSIHQRKVNSNQAWFEYIPAALTKARMGPAGYSPSRDFKRAEVEEGPVADLDDHFLVREANNLAAIRSMAINRTLSWGRLVDLMLPDERSYRGLRGIDTGLLKGSLAPYPLWPVRPEMVEILNAGRNANNGKPPETIRFQGEEIDNPRKKAPLGSVLGAEQKAWLKSSLKKSQAVWKVIGNSTPMLRFGFDVTFRPGEPDNGLLWTDSWDGYPVERRELMSFILEQNLTNVVSLAGDRHAHFAGMIYEDYDAPGHKVVIPEFAGASTSSGCRAKVHGLEIQHDKDLTPLFLSIQESSEGEVEMVPTLNAWLLYGAASARHLHETGDAAAAGKLARPGINPHLEYADTDAYGYMIAHFDPDQMSVEFVTIPEPLVDPGANGPEVKRRIRFTVDWWTAGMEPKLSDPEILGEAPLLGIRNKKA